MAAAGKERAVAALPGDTPKKRTADAGKYTLLLWLMLRKCAAIKKAPLQGLYLYTVITN
jgi:hypothetical protein